MLVFLLSSVPIGVNLVRTELHILRPTVASAYVVPHFCAVQAMFRFNIQGIIDPIFGCNATVDIPIDIEDKYVMQRG